jgi:peptide-methionine (S)-S-oxide reductase
LNYVAPAIEIIAMRNERKVFRTLALFVLLLAGGAGFAQEEATLVPEPTLDIPRAPGDAQKAVLAGGCYWGTQGVFEHVKGVKRVVAGFSGGRSDRDGGAEAVVITFDPGVISYGQLLQIFFSVAHDPTQLNRQGPDEGSSYRSDIFYVNAEQQRIAAAYIAQLEQAKVFPARIVTRVDAFQKFQQAEVSQQDFIIKNPRLNYVMVIDRPKLASLKRLFPAAYLEHPVEFRG